MGVLTDFVVGDRSDARRVCDSSCPSRDFDGIDAKGIDTVKLGTLYAILKGKEYNPLLMSESLYDGGEMGPWVFEVPADLVRRLADLTPSQFAEVGDQWAATEEFSPKYDNWRAERVQQTLADLTALCKIAVDEGKAVLMWMCL